MDNDRNAYSKPVRAKLDKLEAEKHAAELRVRAIGRQIEELLTGQSPIHPGDRITWVSSDRERYGQVVSVSTVWKGFEYRVQVTTKCGRVIGMATVTEQQQPALRQ